jgi:ribosomal-protein-serine acetyltransferase
MIRAMDRPPGYLSHGAVTLRRWRAGDAALCRRLVSESLEHLRPWMPWAAGDYGLARATEYLERCEADWAAGEAFQYLTAVAGNPAGSAGLMARIGPGGLEIGYWVHPAFAGQGVATSAAAALTEAALALPAIERVEIQHDMLNLASERVPAKLGYAHVDTRSSRLERAPGESGTAKVWRITR